jgi:GT2 family glycosyltransferase
MQLPTSSEPALSFVVMFTHDARLARACLTSIAETCDGLPEAEVVLILNASSPEVREVVLEEFKGAHLIESPVNTGTAVAWQLGFAAARGESILLMHEDAALLPGTAAQLFETLNADESAAVVGPWLDEFGPGRQMVNAGWVRFADLNGGLTIASDQVPEHLRSAPYAVQEVSSAMSIWRRSAWEAIGGFEERTFPAISVEADSFAGIWGRGMAVLVDPRAQGKHMTGSMNASPGLLSGRHIRHFLASRFERLWDEKWAPLMSGLVNLSDHGWSPDDIPDEAVALALDELQTRHRELPRLVDPPRSQQPITNPDGRVPPPTEVDAAIVERLVAAERVVIDDYTRWLIERDSEMTRRYEEAYAAYRAEAARSEALLTELEAAQRSENGLLGRIRRKLSRD